MDWEGLCKVMVLQHPPGTPLDIRARYEEALAAVAGLDSCLSVKAAALDFSVERFERLPTGR